MKKKIFVFGLICVMSLKLCSSVMAENRIDDVSLKITDIRKHDYEYKNGIYKEAVGYPIDENDSYNSIRLFGSVSEAPLKEHLSENIKNNAEK